MTKNYNLEMEKIISEEYNRDMPRKKLLLHACCAPCATACLERVKDFFDVAVFFYNPNIDCREEYEKRAEELKRLCGIVGTECVTEDYCADEFLYAAQGTEDMPEGGERCARCFKLRLERTATLAAEKGFDYFGTTLTVSPHKNAEQVNAAGFAAAEKYGIKFLPSDFKKKGGYARSVELSRLYGLYRQNYCGCIFSKRESERMRVKSASEK